MKLRVLYEKGKHSATKSEAFEGDVEKDRAYWKKHQGMEARYFELGKEVTIKQKKE